jgi:hypothetical protein
MPISIRLASTQPSTGAARAGTSVSSGASASATSGGVRVQSGDVGGMVAPLLLLLAQRAGLDPLRMPFAVMGIAASAGALLIAQVRERRGAAAAAAA